MVPPDRPRLPQRDWAWVLGDVTVSLPCGGQVHRVSWRRGKLVLHDHTLRTEGVLGALGGAWPACVEVLVAWQRLRHQAAAVRVDDATFSYFRERGMPLGDQFFAAILPEPLRELRERTTWVRIHRDGRERDPRAEKPIRRVALAALEPLVSTLPARVFPDVHVMPRGRPATALARSFADEWTAQVRLSLDWLVTVGVLGVAAIDDRFVLAAAAGARGARSVAVRTVAWSWEDGVLTPSVRDGLALRTGASWHLREE